MRSSYLKKPVRRGGDAGPGPWQGTVPASHEKWVASLKVGAHLKFIQKWIPKTISVRQNDQEGRYLLYLRGCDRRGVSWTRRGEVLTVKECIRVSWLMHTDLCGEECPSPPEYVSGEA